MIIYKKYGVDKLPKQQWWLINNYLFIIFFLIPAAIMLVFFRDGTFYFALFWLVAGFFTFIFAGRRKSPLMMELRDDTIYYTYSTHFSVVDVEMKLDQIHIELYKNKYFVASVSSGDTRHYLYFNSIKDESVYVELRESSYILGKILSQLEQSQQVALGDRELQYVAKYRAQLEKDRTPMGRVMNILIPLAIISVFGYIIYRAIQNFLEQSTG